MRARAFDLLSRKQKEFLITDKGVFITQRYHYAHWISLYAIEGLLVEMHYHHETNEIGLIEAVKDELTIDRYLDTIELPSTL